MKNVLLQCGYFIIRLLWRLRYRVQYKGLDELKEALKEETKGVLFLPNHPAVFIDPLVVTVPLLQSFSVKPLIVEYMYYQPWFHSAVQVAPWLIPAVS